MDLAAVMEELKTKLTTAIPDLNGSGYPPESVEPAAGIVSYPERIDYGVSYQNGMERIDSLPVVIVVGRVDAASTRDDVAAYAKGSGPKSVLQILEAGPFTNLWTLNVTDCEFGTYVEAGVTYLAATFHCQITGPGN